ncbi:unnamed protein product [Sphagnum balticum]
MERGANSHRASSTTMVTFIPILPPFFKVCQEVKDRRLALFKEFFPDVRKYLPPMSNIALKIVARSANAKDVHPMQERIVFHLWHLTLLPIFLRQDLGWRLMAPQFLDLVENAIFPALKMNEKGSSMGLLL